MATKTWSIALMFLCTGFTSIAQVFYKFGANKLEFNFHALITNYYILAGLVLYAIGAVIMILAFKGGEVSVLYPVVATSYIWVTLLSLYFFHEAINIFRWIGVSVILLGIIFIGIGSKDGTVAYAEAV